MTAGELIRELIESLCNNIQSAQGMNANEIIRSRELSLAITHMEEAEHWLEALDARKSNEDTETWNHV